MFKRREDYWQMGEDGEPVKIGIIDLPVFYLDFAGRAQNKPDYRSSTRDVRRLIGELEEQGVAGIGAETVESHHQALPINPLSEPGTTQGTGIPHHANGSGLRGEVARETVPQRGLAPMPCRQACRFGRQGQPGLGQAGGQREGCGRVGDAR